MSAQSKPEPKMKLVDPLGKSEVFTTEYRWSTYRFLLSDWRTVDVVAIQDGSDLREAVLKRFGVDKIEGVVRLTDKEGT